MEIGSLFTIDFSNKWYPIKASSKGLWLVFGSLAGIHGYLARSKGSYIHGALAIVSLYYPMAMDQAWFHSDLHHSSYGLLMLAMPWTATQAAGGILLFDELYNNNELRLGKDNLIFQSLPHSTKAADNDFMDSLKGTLNPGKMVLSLPLIIGLSAAEQFNLGFRFGVSQRAINSVPIFTGLLWAIDWLRQATLPGVSNPFTAKKA